jgi:hypothetical protein
MKQNHFLNSIIASKLSIERCKDQLAHIQALLYFTQEKENDSESLLQDSPYPRHIQAILCNIEKELSENEMTLTKCLDVLDTPDSIAA